MIEQLFLITIFFVGSFYWGLTVYLITDMVPNIVTEGVYSQDFKKIFDAFTVMIIAYSWCAIGYY